MDNGQQPVGSTPTPDAPAAGAPTPTSTPNLPAPDNNSAHPFFANHPTQTFNNDAGDIILNNGPKPAKNNKTKFLLIILIVILAITAIAAGVWSVMGKSDGNNKTADSAKNDLRLAYNEYANYLMYGTDNSASFSPDELGDYSPLYPYSVYAESVIAGFNTEVNKEQYISNLSEKYKKLAQAYEAFDGAEMGPELNLYFGELASLPDLTSDQILQAYLNQGGTYAQDLIEQTYNLERVPEEFHAYVEAQKSIAELTLATVAAASENNCMESGKINNTCIAESSSSVDQELIEQSSAAYNTISALAYALRSAAMNQLNLLYDLVYGENMEIAQ